MFQQLLRTYFQLPTLFRLVITVLSFLLLFGTVIYLVEPQQFNTIFEGIWWAFITGTTIGYGDYAPVTMLGRFLTMVMILLGGGLVAYYMVAVSNQTQKKKGSFIRARLLIKGRGTSLSLGGMSERVGSFICFRKTTQSHHLLCSLTERVAQTLYRSPSFILLKVTQRLMKRGSRRISMKRKKLLLLLISH